MRTHTTSQGDEWDLVACITYGRKRFDDRNMDLILEANPDLIWLKVLSHNTALEIPEPRIRPVQPIVPWT